MATSGSTIEVERKFESRGTADELRVAVEACGGRTVGEVRFSDAYWDTAECTLTRQDTWLRRRTTGADSAWELKIPLGPDAVRSGGERTVFREVVGADAVRAALTTELGLDAGPMSGADLAEWLARDARMAPFAEFETVRSKYALGQCALDADVASFGHSVLEIEVCVDTPDAVPAAEDEIERVANLVGATPLTASGGKLETYIRRHCPVVLRNLVEAGILRADY